MFDVIFETVCNIIEILVVVFVREKCIGGYIVLL